MPALLAAPLESLVTMAPGQVLALVEPGRHGGAAVTQARLIALGEPAQLTVVALARQATGPRCGTSILDYNRTVAEAASEDIGRVREGLADLEAPVTYTVLPQLDDGDSWPQEC